MFFLRNICWNNFSVHFFHQRPSGDKQLVHTPSSLTVGILRSEREISNLILSLFWEFELRGKNIIYRYLHRVVRYRYYMKWIELFHWFYSCIWLWQPPWNILNYFIYEVWIWIEQNTYLYWIYTYCSWFSLLIIVYTRTAQNGYISHTSSFSSLSRRFGMIAS